MFERASHKTQDLDEKKRARPFAPGRDPVSIVVFSLILAPIQALCIGWRIYPPELCAGFRDAGGCRGSANIVLCRRPALAVGICGASTLKRERSGQLCGAGLTVVRAPVGVG